MDSKVNIYALISETKNYFKMIFNINLILIHKQSPQHKNIQMRKIKINQINSININLIYKDTDCAIK